MFNQECTKLQGLLSVNQQKPHNTAATIGFLSHFCQSSEYEQHKTGSSLAVKAWVCFKHASLLHLKPKLFKPGSEGHVGPNISGRGPMNHTNGDNLSLKAFMVLDYSTPGQSLCSMGVIVRLPVPRLQISFLPM